MKIFFVGVIALSLLCSGHAWDTEELEIFDLVEEIKTNFYDFMGINQVRNFNLILTFISQSVNVPHRMLQIRRSRGPLGVCQFNCIPTRILPKMLIYSSEIWFRYTKFWKSQLNAKNTTKFLRMAFQIGSLLCIIIAVCAK